MTWQQFRIAFTSMITGVVGTICTAFLWRHPWAIAACWLWLIANQYVFISSGARE